MESKSGAASGKIAQDKRALRASVLARRRAVPAQERARRDAALCELVGTVAQAGHTVCAYVPGDDEAGGPEFVTALASVGARVFLPISPRSGALHWAEFVTTSALAPGRFGILEPDTQAHPPEFIAEADVVLIPAVAVDASGSRLGRGRGYYDQSLVLSSPSVRLVAVLDCEDVLAEVPTEEHDVRVHGVLTPNGLLDFGLWHSAG